MIESTEGKHTPMGYPHIRKEPVPMSQEMSEKEDERRGDREGGRKILRANDGFRVIRVNCPFLGGTPLRQRGLPTTALRNPSERRLKKCYQPNASGRMNR